MRKLIIAALTVMFALLAGCATQGELIGTKADVVLEKQSVED